MIEINLVGYKDDHYIELFKLKDLEHLDTLSMAIQNDR